MRWDTGVDHIQKLGAASPERTFAAASRIAARRAALRQQQWQHTVYSFNNNSQLHEHAPQQPATLTWRFAAPESGQPSQRQQLGPCHLPPSCPRSS